MRILSCHVENFGVLSGYEDHFEQGVNLRTLPNGGGKTTLAVFVGVLLYGMEPVGEETGGDLRRRFFPWQGGICGGELVLEQGETRLRITRTFGRERGEDTLEVCDARTNEPLSGYDPVPGERLTGLDRETFFSLFLSLPGEERLTAGRLLELREQESPQRAIALLQKEQSELAQRREQNRLAQERAGRELTAKASPDAERQQLGARRQEAEEKLWSLRARIAREYPQSLSARRGEIPEQEIPEQETQQLAEMGGLRADIGELNQQLALLRERLPGRVPAGAEIDRQREKLLEGRRIRELHRRQSLRRRAGAGTSLLLLGTVTAALGRGRLLWSAVSAVVLTAGILLLYSLVLRLRRADAESSADADTVREVAAFWESLQWEPEELSVSPAPEDEGPGITTDEALQELEQLRACALQLQETQRRLDDSREELERLQERSRQRLESERGAADVSGSVPEGLALLREEEESCLSRVRLLAGREMALSEEQSRLEKLRERERMLVREGETLERQERVAGEAIRALQRTQENLQRRLAGEVTRAFSQCFARVWQPEAGAVVEADEELVPYLVRGGERTALSSLGGGAGDLVRLCRRLALIRVLCPGERPPLILDEPLPRIDERRGGAAMELIRQEAREGQILYLTCEEYEK